MRNFKIIAAIPSFVLRNRDITTKILDKELVKYPNEEFAQLIKQHAFNFISLKESTQKVLKRPINFSLFIFKNLYYNYTVFVKLKDTEENNKETQAFYKYFISKNRDLKLIITKYDADLHALSFEFRESAKQAPLKFKEKM